MPVGLMGSHMVQTNKPNWNEDWEAFVRSVGQSFDHGLDDRAVTRLYSGRPAIWTGKVTRLRLDGDRPGVQLEMPLIEFDFSDGRRGRVDYLFLHLVPEDVQSWKQVVVGAAVRFQTSINGAEGIFPGIRWCDFDDNRGTVMFGTTGGILLP